MVIHAVLGLLGRLIIPGISHVSHEIPLQSVPVLLHLYQTPHDGLVAYFGIVVLTVIHLLANAEPS